MSAAVKKAIAGLALFVGVPLVQQYLVDFVQVCQTMGSVWGMLKPHQDASLAATARRVLADKVAVKLLHLEAVAPYTGPDRDQRGWSVMVLFYALLPLDKTNAVVRNMVEAVEWADAVDPGQRLAFDHA